MTADIGKRIAQMRRERGYNQEQLAEMAMISRVTLARYETGAIEPGALAIGRIADALGVSTDELLCRVDKLPPFINMVKDAVPIVGEIACGKPITAEQNIEGYFPLPAGQLGKKNTFMLSVHGNSMVEAGILNGDYVLVEEQNTADNGDIVVAMVEGMDSEATVKAFYKENGHIRLQPRNSEMDPIIVDNCTIVGKVKGVFRYLS